MLGKLLRSRQSFFVFLVGVTFLWVLVLYGVREDVHRYSSTIVQPPPERTRQQYERKSPSAPADSGSQHIAIFQNAPGISEAKKFRAGQNERTHLSLQVIGDPDIRRVRVLVLSWHGGTMKDTVMQLHAAGVRHENIVCEGAVWYEQVLDSAPCVRDGLLAKALNPLMQSVPGFPNEIDTDETWLTNFTYKATDWLGRFDVLWADFPAVLCLLLHNIAPNKLIVRTTHRFDHQVAHVETNSTSFIRKKLLHVLRNAPILLAGSEYDWAYIRYYTCREPERLFITWPTQYFESLGAPYTLTNESAFILWGGSNEQGSRSISITFDRIRELASKQKSYLPIKSRPKKFRHASEFATEQAAVYFPYSMPSSAFHELYASGVPLFVPSLAFMLREFSKHRGYPHKVAGNSACGAPSFYENAEFASFCCLRGTDDSEVCHDPNSCDPEALRQWVPLGDIYTTPHLTYFDSAEHAVELMKHWMQNPNHRYEVIEAMAQYNVANIRQNTAVVQAAIRHIRHVSLSQTP